MFLILAASVCFLIPASCLGSGSFSPGCNLAASWHVAGMTSFYDGKMNEISNAMYLDMPTESGRPYTGDAKSKATYCYLLLGNSRWFVFVDFPKSRPPNKIRDNDCGAEVYFAWAKDHLPVEPAGLFTPNKSLNIIRCSVKHQCAHGHPLTKGFPGSPTCSWSKGFIDSHHCDPDC